MSVKEFLQKPTSQLHPYDNSPFALYPAPEYATGEVLLAGLYRKIGYDLSEQKAVEVSKDFKKRVEGGLIEGLPGIPTDCWREILSDFLSSPLRPGQQKQQVYSLTPIVPGACAFSGTARQSGNPWSPGSLVSCMIEYGSGSSESAHSTWERVFNALSVDQQDDPWARWINEMFVKSQEEGLEWKARALNERFPSVNWQMWSSRGPATQFVKDLDKLLSIRKVLTRRQWISLFESLLRISSTSHVAWICCLNKRLYDFLESCLGGLPPEEAWRKDFESFQELVYWSYGQWLTPQMNRLAQDYITGRYGTNLVLAACHESLAEAVQGLSFNTPDDVRTLGRLLHDNRQKIDVGRVKETLLEILESNPRLLSCDNGIPKNIKEFFQYTLGQRPSQSSELRSYDQGYWARKHGEHTAAKWYFEAGPVSLYTLVTCFQGTTRAPRNVEDFCRYLRNYGISISASEIPHNGMGDSLRSLGLVIDSPDAEGGMTLQDPFMIQQGGC